MNGAVAQLLAHLQECARVTFGAIMAHADILIYALIAVVLLVRLWVVFGRRNDNDRQRPNPFAAPPPGTRDDEDVMVLAKRPETAAPALLAPAPLSLAGALEAAKKLDPSFDEKKFLQDARGFFTIIVGDFATGDLSRSRTLLGPSVLPHFEAAIAARVKAGETLESRIIRIRETETAAARIEDTQLFIAVRFVSEQENILCDASGKIVSGAPGKVEEITDLWTFARDTRALTPAWQLVETKSV